MIRPAHNNGMTRISTHQPGLANRTNSLMGNRDAPTPAIILRDETTDCVLFKNADKLSLADKKKESRHAECLSLSEFTDEMKIEVLRHFEKQNNLDDWPTAESANNNLAEIDKPFNYDNSR